MNDQERLMTKVIDSIESNWKDIKRGIENNWDSETFYRLGQDFADIIYKSIKETEDMRKVEDDLHLF